MFSGSPSQLRWRLAFLVVGFVLLFAVSSIWIPSALVVLDRLLPALMLVLGFHFGQAR